MLRAAVMLGRRLLSCAPAPHTLRYIHDFARIEIAQERRCFVVPLISRRAISNQILLILLILSKTSTRSTCSTRLNINHLLFRVFRGSYLSAYSAALRLCVKTSPPQHGYYSSPDFIAIIRHQYLTVLRRSTERRCRSFVRRTPPDSIVTAAIQMSLVGIGVPAFLSDA